MGNAEAPAEAQNFAKMVALSTSPLDLVSR